MIGTGARKAMFGQENQRAAMCGIDQRRPHADDGDGEHRADQAAPAERARPVLQVALGLEDQPAGAKQRIAEHQRKPANTENGVKQSNELPTKWRPSTWKPWMNEPSTTPCANVASAEPAAKP